MPFPLPAVFSAVSAAVNVAYFIYDKGMRSNVPYDQDYAQLVNAVREFRSSLQSTQDVFDQASNEVARNQVEGYLSHDYSLQNFKTIVGDFQATLEDCNKLLEAKESYGRNHGGLQNTVAWNVTAREEVKELRGRIMFHHTRFSMMLQPLSLSLIQSVKECLLTAMERGFRDMHQNHREVMDNLTRLTAHFGLDPPQEPQVLPDIQPPIPHIPDYLLAKFDTQAVAESDVPLSDEIRISSIMGHLTETFHADTISSNMPRDQVIRRYVNLMKAAWILNTQSRTTADVTGPTSSLTVAMWQDLRRKVSEGVTAFTNGDGNNPSPSTDEIRALPNSHFALWLFQPGSRPLEPKAVNINEVLLIDMPLEATTATERQQLLVVGSLIRKQKLRIVTSFIDSLGRPRDRNAENIDTSTVVLQPTYAQANAELSNLQIRSSAQDQQSLSFQFRKLNDLFRFQRCLTGFEVKHDQPGISSVKFKYSGLRGVKPMQTLSTDHDTVRAQIWYHNPLCQSKQPTTVRSGMPSSRNSSSPRSPTTGSSFSLRRRSHASSTQSQTMSIDEWAKEHAPSSITLSQLTVNATAQEIPDLEEPKVVIFLSIADVGDTNPHLPRRIKKLQYFAFSMRDGIYVDTSSCRCRTDDNCQILVIKGRGALNARLYEDRHDLANWNLAALGQAEHVDADRCVRRIEDLDRIVMTFKLASDRKLFSKMLTKVIALYEAKRQDRDRDIDNVQRADVV